MITTKGQRDGPDSFSGSRSIFSWSSLLACFHMHSQVDRPIAHYSVNPKPVEGEESVVEIDELFQIMIDKNNVICIESKHLRA